MLDQKDLQAIEQIMDSKIVKSEERMSQRMDDAISASEARMSKRMDEAISASEARMSKRMDDAISASEQRTKQAILESEQRTMQGAATLMESYFGPKFDLLFENQQLMLEKLAPKSRLDEMEDEISVLRATVRRHSDEIEALKRA